MSDTPKASVKMQDFPGLITKADPRDIPEGAAEEQVNARSERTGELTIRRGYRVIQFEG